MASVSNKTETSITIKWTSDTTIDRVRYRYSTNGGSSYNSWTSKTVNAKSGSYTLSSLTPNTTYTIQTELRKSGTSTVTTETTTAKTYNWPKSNAPTVNIYTDALVLTLTNPLERACEVEISVNGSFIESFSNVKTTVSVPATDYYRSRFLQQIPNAASGTYTVTVRYSGHEMTTTGTFRANGAVPTITGTPTYQDTNSTAQAIIQNNQKILQTISTPRFTVSGTALYGATIASASVTILENTVTGTASGNTANVNYGTINSGSNVTAKVTITDSRGQTASKNITVTMMEYEQPHAVITLQRQNNYYSETDLKVDAYVMYATGNYPTITGRYRQIGGSTWTTIPNIQDNVTKTIVLDNTKEYELEITVSDQFGGSRTYGRNDGLIVNIGMPIIYFDRVKRSVGINCFPYDSNTLEIQGRNIYKAIFRLPNSYTYVSNIAIPGVVTAQGKKARFTLNTAQNLSMISSITVLQLYGGVRVPAGGYMNGFDDSYDWVSQNGITVSATVEDDNVITIGIDSTTAFTNVSNNMPVTMFVAGLQLEFL